MPGGKTHSAIGVGVGLALGAMLPLSTALPWQLGLTVTLATISALAPDLDIADNELEEMGRSEGRGVARRLRRAGRRGGCLWRVLMQMAGVIVLMVGEIISRLVEAVAWVIQRVTSHRGLTHSLIVALVVALAALNLSVALTPTHTAWWGFTWSAGYLSHLAADALTISGLKLFQPWSQRRFWLLPYPLRFRVGSWPDTLLGTLAPLLGLTIFLVAHGLPKMLGAMLGK
jgi:membrane-bound metal-dependent hydrolase YbcI (DUF457 family)